MSEVANHEFVWRWTLNRRNGSVLATGLLPKMSIEQADAAFRLIRRQHWLDWWLLGGGSTLEAIAGAGLQGPDYKWETGW